MKSRFTFREVNFGRELWVLMWRIIIPEGGMASHLMKILRGLVFIFHGETFGHTDRAYSTGEHKWRRGLNLILTARIIVSSLLGNILSGRLSGRLEIRACVDCPANLSCQYVAQSRQREALQQLRRLYQANGVSAASKLRGGLFRLRP